MTKTKSLLLAASASLATLAILGGIALADDGGLMRQMMGDGAYMAMVTQMRVVLGSERADQLIASCEAMMASAPGGATTAPGATQNMMSGMGSMMGGGR